MKRRTGNDPAEPIVVTGIGLIAATGRDREAVWRSVQAGKSGVRKVTGLLGIPDGTVIAAQADCPIQVPGRTKIIELCHRVAGEAIRDAGVNFAAVDRTRFGCAISAHMGDTDWIDRQFGAPPKPQGAVEWWEQLFPSTSCMEIGRRFGLYGPRLTHSTACASGTVELLSAVRAIQDDQCDICLAGSAEALTPLLIAGFRQMRVLAAHDDPTQACRPFDRHRQGFVLGEGGAMFVVERLSHAVARGARIYAEVVSGKILSEGLHVTSLDAESRTLTEAIVQALRKAKIAPDDVGYINVHGTGTLQNDVCEAIGIRKAFGGAADRIPVSATKSMLGHLLNAAGSVELAITILAMRDGYVPPTINLTDPDPQCRLNHLRLVGSPLHADIAVKLSVAFGGHVVAVVLRRWNDVQTGFAYPRRSAAA